MPSIVYTLFQAASLFLLPLKPLLMLQIQADMVKFNIKISKYAVFFIVMLNSILITSCAYRIVSNKTKRILNPGAIHLNDTLGIITPFTAVYITLDKNNFYDNNYKPFVKNEVAPNCQRYPIGEIAVNNHIKISLQKYFKCFQHKADVKISLTDSSLIKRQITSIEQPLKDSLFTQLQIPDSLYNCLIKYGHRQYLIIDEIEYYYAVLMDTNVHCYYRFFIFDMSSKIISFYGYYFNQDFASPKCAPTDRKIATYCYNRREIFMKFSRKIKRACTKNINNKK